MSRLTYALGRGNLYVLVPRWIGYPVLRWVPGATGGVSNHGWGGRPLHRLLPFVRVYRSEYEDA